LPEGLVDSERILTTLRSEGYEISREHAGAEHGDREHLRLSDSAQAESLDAIGAAMAENGKVVVTGCMGAEPEKIAARFPTCSPSPARSNMRAWSRRCIALPADARSVRRLVRRKHQLTPPTMPI